MVYDTIKPRRIGRWCLPYVKSRIGEASPPLQTIARDVDLSKGYTFVYIPPKHASTKFHLDVAN
jgi:hypothetical protein